MIETEGMTDFVEHDKKRPGVSGNISTCRAGIATYVDVGSNECGFITARGESPGALLGIIESNVGIFVVNQFEYDAGDICPGLQPPGGELLPVFA